MACIKKRRIAVVLLISLAAVLALPLISCSRGIEYDEGELLAAAEELIKRSESLNSILYGTGIRASAAENAKKYGAYVEAAQGDLTAYGIKSVSDIERMIGETYTKDYSALLIKTKLSGASSDGTGSFARYINVTLSGDTDATFMVYDGYPVMLRGTAVYDYGTLRITGTERSRVIVGIYVLVSDGERSQTKEISVGLRREDKGWRLDDATYASYTADYQLSD